MKVIPIPPPWKRVYAIEVEGARITFTCREGHTWTEVVVGAPPNPLEYWGRENGGVHAWCPTCDPENFKAAKRERTRREKRLGLRPRRIRP